MHLLLMVQVTYEIKVQLLEIYNEQLRDLLDASRSGKRLDIRNTERSGVNVPDAIQVRPCLSICSLPIFWSCGALVAFNAVCPLLVTDTYATAAQVR